MPCAFVKVFEACEEMLGVGLVCVFHTKVVDAKGERYLAADLNKEPGGVLSWHVPRGLEVVFESVVGNETGLLQVVNTFPNFH